MKKTCHHAGQYYIAGHTYTVDETVLSVLSKHCQMVSESVNEVAPVAKPKNIKAKKTTAMKSGEATTK